MEISLSGLGKRFNQTWLFRHLDHTINQPTAITGPNGSGKSTLLQLIMGYTLPSEGTICWRIAEQNIPAEEQYRYLAVSAPYLELIEEFTLHEHLAFHFRFKSIRGNHTIQELITLGYFEGEEQKLVKQFSSGMKQRLKLLLALYSDVPVILLDEPTTNMDSTGIKWYQDRIAALDIPLLIIGSNDPNEYQFCRKTLDLTGLKK